MANGPSASGNGSFPASLHVLAVDDDVGALVVLTQTLLLCSYRVTTCRTAEDALSLIMENNARFDVLFAEIRLPGMGGFQLLAEVSRLPMNLPIILMTADPNEDIVKRGIFSGAWYVLSKPVSTDVLQTVWQLPYLNTSSSDFGKAGSAAPVAPIGGSEEKRDCTLGCSTSQEGPGHDSSVPDADRKRKKPRFSWTEERHRLFVEALEFLGEVDDVPTKILDYMQRKRKEPYLTRHVVSSHLQKYRGKRSGKRRGASSAKRNSLGTPYSRDTAASPVQSVCLDPDDTYMWSSHHLQPPYEFQQGFGCAMNTPSPSDHPLRFQDWCDQDLGYSGFEI